MGGNKSKGKSRPLILPLTETDLALEQIALALAQGQQSIFGQTADAQNRLFEALNNSDFAQGLVDSALAGNDPLSQSILAQEQARLDGGGISDAQRSRIRGAADAALAAAGSDIEAFAAGQRQSLISDLTPSLGLRPSDTPIVLRGQRIGEEATRQFSQAARDIQGQALQAELNLPLEEAGRNASLLQLQGQLANEAFNRRLSLGESAVGSGIAASGPGAISGTVAAVKDPKSAGQVSKESRAGGGIFSG